MASEFTDFCLKSGPVAERRDCRLARGCGGFGSVICAKATRAFFTRRTNRSLIGAPALVDSKPNRLKDIDGQHQATHDALVKATAKANLPRTVSEPIAHSPKSIRHIRAGVIGTGFIGPVHIEALRRLGVQVTALCDLPDRVGAAAEKYGIPHAFRDYRELLASPELDVVHITVPNRYHCEMALAALENGKHCVCEKPLAMNTGQTQRIVAAARGSKNVFAVNYNVRFYPAVLHLRNMVARGQLGDIIHVNGSYLQDWLLKETDYNWRLLPEEGGKLRAVADIGTHWMDTVCFILGARINSVFADLRTWHRTRKRPLGEVQTFARASRKLKYAYYRVTTDDFANILLQFSNNAQGNLGVSQVAAGRKNCIRIEIYGSLQSAWWCSEDPERVHVGNRDEPNQLALRGTPNFGPDVVPYVDYPAGHVEGFPDTFKMLFRSVYSTIADGGRGKRLFAGVTDGHEEVAVCEAIWKSHASRKWTRV